MNRMNPRRSRHRRDGSTTVEMALILPIFFLLMFAAYEFGRANLIRHAAQSAAYEAAREAIVPGASNADAQAVAMVVLNSVGVDQFTFTTIPANIQTISSEVEVNIAVPLDQNLAFANFLSGFVFTGHSRLSRERR